VLISHLASAQNWRVKDVFLCSLFYKTSLGRITEETVDRIYNAALIEEVIGDFVQLKKSGANYKGLSPFTDEKTPSFYVSPAKGIFKCFSTGTGGNVTKFLMEQEKMTYPEALRWLADKYGIEIEEEEVSDEEKDRVSERESLSIVVNYAKDWFADQLWNSEEGQNIGLSYLRERGLRDDIIKTFELGYCPDSWTAFSDEAKKNGYSMSHMETVGLVKTGEKGTFDFYKGRITFPIRNQSGKAIGFGARTLRSDKKIAKYFNSPENPLYHKSNVLYGIDLARKEMVSADVCYLVEGYTDVISLYQCGITNVVASSGTSLTDGQIGLIKRYTKNITILFDGDAAGIKASFRGIDMILKSGLNVKVVLFPEGEDPDSFAKSHSSSEVAAYIVDNSKDFIVFKTDLLAAEAEGDPLKRAELIKQIVASIALIPDAIKRTVYLQECSQLLKLDERILLQETNKLHRKTLVKQTGQPMPVAEPPAEPQTKKKVSAAAQERDVIRLLLNYGKRVLRFPFESDEGKHDVLESTVAEYFIHQVAQDDLQFEDPCFNAIFEEYSQEVGAGTFPDEKYFGQHPDMEVSSMYADLTLKNDLLSEKWEQHEIYTNREEDMLGKAVKDGIYRWKLRTVQLMVKAKQEQLKQESLEDKEWMQIMQDIKKLDATKMELSKYFGTAIL